MPTIHFYQKSEIADEDLKYAVIAARQNGKWIFCQHKERDTWEILGGHRESGEIISETAKRELYEETGAIEYDLNEVCVYGVEREGKLSCGMLFFAEIRTLGELPAEMEIGEIAFFGNIPDKLTYPEIQPHLFIRTQEWLNLQTSVDEIWDIYDENRVLTGRKHRRGDPLQKGDYHLVVHVWLQNQKGEFLLTKRTPNKGYPNMWECTGGSALAGDNSLMAALREQKEETGLNLLTENGRCILSYTRTDAIVDVWLFKQEFDLNEVTLLPNETCDVRSADRETILRLKEEGKLVPFPYLEELFEKIAANQK